MPAATMGSARRASTDDARRELRSTKTDPDRWKNRIARFGRIAWRWTKRGLVVLAAMGVLALVALVLVIRHYESQLPSVPDLKSQYHPAQVTRVLAKDGSALAELFTQRRTVVKIDTLPAHVKLAVLAAEDANFYEHEGLNYLGIARAMLVNLRSGRTRQGGSTITQQVVKNLLLDSERTYSRKVREALLARRLEQELEKDEILELYLNHIYFGNGRYGIEEAARDLFGKPAKELSIGEAALLAGLPAGPEVFSPRKNMGRALERRVFVLGQMRAKHFLDQKQYDAAKSEPLRLAAEDKPESELAPEVIETVRKELAKLAPESAERGGFTVTTTIDPALQRAAREAVRRNLQAYDERHALIVPLKMPKAAKTSRKSKSLREEKIEPVRKYKPVTGIVEAVDEEKKTIDVRVRDIVGTLRASDFDRYNPKGLRPSELAPIGAEVRVSLLADAPRLGNGAIDEGARVPMRVELGPQSAFVAIDPRTREVRALVGSYEGQPGGLDRATAAKRQPGSTFKPIVYSYAIHARRVTASTLIDVSSGKFAGGYTVKNYEAVDGAQPMRLREALAHSVNVAAVRVLEDVGPVNVVEWARSLGIQSSLKPDLSLALGSYEVTPLELAGVYATFAAGGVYERPVLITKVVGPDGAPIELGERPPAERVMSEAEAYVLTNLLSSVIDHGTGARARVLKRPLAGKTGTTNHSKDAWFAGYSTEVAAVTWVGYDDGTPLGRREQGALTALPAWIDFMRAAHENKPSTEFARPEGVELVAIDKRTGGMPFEGDTEVVDEVFLTGTEPTAQDASVLGRDASVGAAPPIDGAGALAPAPWPSRPSPEPPRPESPAPLEPDEAVP